MKFLLFALLSFAAAPAQQPAPPQRIIAASPDVTEILYGIGAFGRVVAVTDYCTYPPAVKKLPRIGQWENSNLEAIVSLRPDLVIFTDGQTPFLAGHLRDLGIRFLSVPTLTLADVFTSARLIGKATGREAPAEALVARVKSRLDAVRARTRTLPRRRVLLIVDRMPGTLRDLYAATHGSFMSELIEIAGGDCVGAPAPGGYAKLSLEALVDLSPDVVIDFVHGAKTRLSEDPKTVWADLRELPAVRLGHVYPLENDFLPHASQFVADTAELFARLLHPEVFH